MNAADLLRWRPSFWLRIRIWLRERDIAVLRPDQLSVALHNEHIAKAALIQAAADYRRYRKERRSIEHSVRLNERANVRDEMVLVARGAR